MLHEKFLKESMSTHTASSAYLSYTYHLKLKPRPMLLSVSWLGTQIHETIISTIWKLNTLEVEYLIYVVVHGNLRYAGVIWLLFLIRDIYLISVWLGDDQRRTTLSHNA